MADPLKVFVVDDSSLYRRILTKAVETMPVATLVETAPSGAIALKKIPLFKPDILVLDIEMPEMGGLEVLGSVKKEYPQLTVVLVSGANSRSADVTIEGLTSGAADFIAKPAGASVDENIGLLQRGLQTIFDQIGERRQARAARKAIAVAPTVPKPRDRPYPSLVPPRIEIVGVGISTGGPNALEQLIPLFSSALRVPILIVQHMPPLFTSSLARTLDKRSTVPVFEAAPEQVLEAGCVYIARGGIHTVVKRRSEGERTRLVVALDDGPPENSCKPAVDVMFRSLAATTGARTLAVVMTGMGQDGLDGARAIKEKMGYCLTQDEQSCTIYGMPQAVDQAQLSDESLPLAELAGRILALTQGALP